MNSTSIKPPSEPTSPPRKALSPGPEIHPRVAPPVRRPLAAGLVHGARFLLLAWGLWCFYCALRNADADHLSWDQWKLVAEDVLIGAACWLLACRLLPRCSHE